MMLTGQPGTFHSSFDGRDYSATVTAVSQGGDVTLAISAPAATYDNGNIVAGFSERPLGGTVIVVLPGDYAQTVFTPDA